MMTKACPRYKKELPLLAFNADKTKRDGKDSFCRECRGTYRRQSKDLLMVAQKERRKRKRDELALKTKAHNAVYYAKRTGKIEKPTLCEICGIETNLQGHHEDYTNLLDVVWVCQKCHVQLDNERRAGD